jgi:hypothetical protein
MAKGLADYRYDAYISYNRRTDARLVKELATTLSDDYGLQLFLDEWRLAIGDSFTEAIDKALEESRFIIFIISPSGLKSPWLDLEIRSALTTKTSWVLPVLVNNAEPPSFIEPLKSIHLETKDRQSISEAAREIADVIEQNSQPKGKVVRRLTVQKKSKSLPPLDYRGSLPEGIYRTSLEEVIERFGVGSKQRQLLARRLNTLYKRAQKMGADSLMIGGSFISDVSNPKDLDVVIILPEQGTNKIVQKDLDVIQTYISTGKSTFIASDKESVQHWTHFLKNSFLGEPRGVVEINLTGGRK